MTDNYSNIANKLPKNIKLVAVSKTKPNEHIINIYNKGHRDFGENKVQELVSKFESLPKDIRWHMIGHLQTNKVKYIAPFVSLIHSVETIKLLKEINKRAKQNDRIIDCLLEVHIAEEDSKFGLKLQDVADFVLLPEQNNLENVRIRGLMGMATNTSDENQISAEFQKLKKKFEEVKKMNFRDQKHFTEISMGMSNDFEIAISQGATIIRVGSLIFGKR